jgi:uncharacterized membrane protein
LLSIVARWSSDLGDSPAAVRRSQAERRFGGRTTRGGQAPMNFHDAVETAGKVIDAAGVAVIVSGALLATATFVIRGRDAGSVTAYRSYRQALSRAILLGLEFLVAADIVRTVAIDPSFTSAGVLAVIVVIRTFLSMSLELEISGRWPWQQRERPES